MNELKEKIEGIPFPFIFNFDEKGEQQYADALEKSVIVPASYEYVTAPYAVSRTGKRARVLTCISPNGLMSQPQYVVPRLTVDSKIFQYIPANSIQVVHTKTGFINTKSFIFWFKTCIIEKLNNLRLFHNYFGPAIIFLDGYKSHEIALNSLDLEQYNICIHYLVPHSSDQSQPLDIGIFGPMKIYDANFKNKPGIPAQSNQILKIHFSLLCVCNELNCHSAFRSIGIFPKSVTSTRPPVEVAGFDELKCNKIRAYDISHINDLVNRNIKLTPNF